MTLEQQSLSEAQCDAHLCLSKGFSFGDFRCAPTVHESIVFNTLELALSEKQVPRFIGNVSSC
jgi:hypothetical protein